MHDGFKDLLYYYIALTVLLHVPACMQAERPEFVPVSQLGWEMSSKMGASGERWCRLHMPSAAGNTSQQWSSSNCAWLTEWAGSPGRAKLKTGAYNDFWFHRQIIKDDLYTEFYHNDSGLKCHSSIMPWTSRNIPGSLTVLGIFWLADGLFVRAGTKAEFHIFRWAWRHFPSARVGSGSEPARSNRISESASQSPSLSFP